MTFEQWWGEYPSNDPEKMRLAKLAWDAARETKPPSREWLRRMADAEDQCESVSVGVGDDALTELKALRQRCEAAERANDQVRALCERAGVHHPDVIMAQRDAAIAERDAACAVLRGQAKILDELRAERDRAVELLRSLEWSETDGAGARVRCPVCHQGWQDGMGRGGAHNSGCRLDALIAEVDRAKEQQP